VLRDAPAALSRGISALSHAEARGRAVSGSDYRSAPGRPTAGRPSSLRRFWSGCRPTAMPGGAPQVTASAACRNRSGYSALTQRRDRAAPPFWLRRGRLPVRRLTQGSAFRSRLRSARGPPSRPTRSDAESWRRLLTAVPIQLARKGGAAKISFYARRGIAKRCRVLRITPKLLLC
jgi:hypothetical protein